MLKISRVDYRFYSRQLSYEQHDGNLEPGEALKSEVKKMSLIPPIDASAQEEQQGQLGYEILSFFL